MGGLRSARGGLRALREHFLTIGVVILAVVLGFVLLAGCGTAASTAAAALHNRGSSVDHHNTFQRIVT